LHVQIFSSEAADICKPFLFMQDKPYFQLSHFLSR
jgi:hypothetical protein